MAMHIADVSVSGLEKRLYEETTYQGCIYMFERRKDLHNPKSEKEFGYKALNRALDVADDLYDELLPLRSIIINEGFTDGDILERSKEKILGKLLTDDICVHVAMNCAVDDSLKCAILKKGLELTRSCMYCEWIYHMSPPESRIRLDVAQKLQNLVQSGSCTTRSDMCKRCRNVVETLKELDHSAG